MSPVIAAQRQHLPPSSSSPPSSSPYRSRPSQYHPLQPAQIQDNEHSPPLHLIPEELENEIPFLGFKTPREDESAISPNPIPAPLVPRFWNGQSQTPTVPAASIIGIIIGVLGGVSLLLGVAYVYLLRARHVKMLREKRRSRRRRASSSAASGPGPPPPPPPAGGDAPPDPEAPPAAG